MSPECLEVTRQATLSRMYVPQPVKSHQLCPAPGHTPQPRGKPHTPQWRRNGCFQRPTVTSNGQPSLPTANGHFQRPTATSSGQRSLPVATSNGQRPLPMANAHFQWPLPTANGRFQQPLPAAKCLPHPRAGGEGCRGGSGRVAWCVAVSCRLSRPRGPEPQRPLAGSRRLCPGGRQKVKGFQ